MVLVGEWVRKVGDEGGDRRELSGAFGWRVMGWRGGGPCGVAQPRQLA